MKRFSIGSTVLNQSPGGGGAERELCRRRQLRVIRAFFQEKSDAKGLQKHSFIHSFHSKTAYQKRLPRMRDKLTLGRLMKGKF